MISDHAKLYLYVTCNLD